MGRGLCAIHQRDHVVFARNDNHFTHGVDGTQRVRHMREACDFCARIEQFFVGNQIKFAVIEYWCHANFGALLVRYHLPRHNIGVMLQCGQNYFVVGFQILAAPTVGYQVDAFGGAAGKDDFALFFGIDKRLQLAARGFVLRRRGFREVMHSAMDVRVLARLITHPAIHHGFRHLA